MSIAFLALALGIASAYHTGAPGELACGTMTPQHGFPAQTGNSPFRIIMTQMTSTGDQDPIGITLSAPSQGAKFRGFFIQIRAVGGVEPVGQFNPTMDPNAQPVTCNEKPNTAMTHKDNTDKDQIKLQWTPPQGDGQYEAFVTFVEKQDTFWVKQAPDGGKITVTSNSGSNGSNPGQNQSNSGSADNASSDKNNSSQPPSEGAASRNIPFWSGISVTAATLLISFFRFTNFRLF